MCEVTLNGETYRARFIERLIDRDVVRQGDHTFSGRDAFNAVTFEFEEDMNFLKNLQPMTINSNGDINLDNQDVIKLKIDAGDPRVVTFKLRN